MQWFMTDSAHCHWLTEDLGGASTGQSKRVFFSLKIVVVFVQDTVRVDSGHQRKSVVVIAQSIGVPCVDGVHCQRLTEGNYFHCETELYLSENG